GDQIAAIKGCDLLMIPVGGYYTIGCQKAFEMVGQIDPKVVIPMHYKSKKFGYDVLSGREEFVELIGNEGEREIVSRRFTAEELPKEKSLLLMEPLRILK
ncbi:MAG: MBL fold metallo-hydrolase, partial [Oscillospiraceae bacterium]|nr:MBL fold metallo-hydrolase [Oscillospiraceae bacterium]